MIRKVVSKSNRIDKLISQRSSVKQDREEDSETWVVINLRLPLQMLERIGKVIRRDRIGISRNAWLLEAISDKMKNKDEE